MIILYYINIYSCEYRSLSTTSITLIIGNFTIVTIFWKPLSVSSKTQAYSSSLVTFTLIMITLSPYLFFCWALNCRVFQAFVICFSLGRWFGGSFYMFEYWRVKSESIRQVWCDPIAKQATVQTSSKNDQADGDNSQSCVGWRRWR